NSTVTQHPPRTLGAILYPDFELLDYYGPLEMFGSTGLGLKIVTLAERAGPVRSVQGPSTVAEFAFRDAPPLDLILLPGGIGTMEQLGNTAMLDFLRQQSAKSEVVMSVCSGSAILAKAGLLDARRATSNKLFFSLATDQSDKVKWIEQARWVEDGKFFTSSGVSAGTDMALGVIAKLYGRPHAEQVAVMTEYTWQSDPTLDPFSSYLNQGDIHEYLAHIGRA
ncbi:MAG: DJ-1/PfpI family protein, partial [Gammaproteobacteria bacterium]